MFVNKFVISSTITLMLSLSLCISKEEITIEKEEGVFILNSKNYEAAVTKYEYLLVYFYAPWCGHCKALGPEYVKAAQLLKEKDSSIRLAKVDGSEEEELLKKMHVQGYPTLFFYREHEPIKYEGGRFAIEIVAWLEKKIGPPAQVLEDKNQVKDFISDNDVAVVAFFKDPESKLANDYKNAVRDYEEYPCAISSDEEAMKANLAEDGQVVLFKKFDEGRAVYQGAISTIQLHAFIRKYATPLVVDFNHDSAQKIFKNLTKAHILFFVSKTSQDFNDISQTISDVAEEFRYKVMFVLVDLDEDDNRRIVEFLGMKNQPMPQMRIVQMTEDVVKYRPEHGQAKLTEDNIRNFVQGFLDGKIPVHYLNEPLPEDWDSKPVKYLVGSNFDKVVFDKSKNVLVEFYAPWCGHCKQLEPVWNKLAESLSEKEDVLVAKMDATANELPHTTVRSFPTIKLYKKESNEAVEYNGERTLAGISKFLNTDGEYGRAAPDTNDSVEEPDDNKKKDESSKKKESHDEL